MSGMSRVEPGGAIEVTPPSVFLQDWQEAARHLPAADPAAHLGVSAGDHVLVVVAHPDDETFGCGATIAALGQAGVSVHVVSMTAGEAALDHVGRSVSGLAVRRREEFAHACRWLGVASATILDLPDSALGDHRLDIGRQIAALVEQIRPAHVLTTWWGEPHADHAALGSEVAAVADHTGTQVSGCLIWALHWLQPDDVLTREPSVTLISSSRFARRARSQAVATYSSQTQALAADLMPVLSREMTTSETEILVAR